MGNFYKSQVGFGNILREIFSSKALNIEFYSLFDIFFCYFEGFTLRSYIKFRTSGDKEIVS
jgi:hypothetical protein